MLGGQKFGVPWPFRAPRWPILGLIPVLGLLPIIASRCGSLAAGACLCFTLAEIGTERLTQAMIAGLALASRLRLVSLPSGHGQDYTAGALRVKCEDPELAWIFPLWQGPRATLAGYISRLRAPI